MLILLACVLAGYADHLPGEDVPLVRSCVAQACPAGVPSDPQEAAIGLMRWYTLRWDVRKIAGTPTVPIVRHHTGAQALGQKPTNCYWRACALRALCVEAGIPARVVSLWGSGAGCHTVMEAWWDGSWHMLDPWWRAVFLDRAGAVVSLEAIQTDPEARRRPMQINQRTGALEPMSRTALYSPGVTVYQAVVSMMLDSTVAQDRDAADATVMQWALAGPGALGTADGSLWDLAGMTERGQVAHELGRQRVRLIVKPRHAYRVTWTTLADVTGRTLDVLPLDGCIVQGVYVSGWTITVDLYARRMAVEALVELSGKPVFVDQVAVIGNE